MANTVAVKQPRNDWVFHYRGFIVAVAKVLNAVGITFLMLMMMITVVDVFTRWFGIAILGAFEIVQYTMVIAVFLCFGHCQAEGGNISVELLYDRWSKKTQHIVRFVYYIVAVVLFGYITWAVILNAFHTIQTGAYSGVLMVPDWPFVFVEAIGYLCLTLVLVSDIFLAAEGFLFGVEEAKIETEIDHALEEVAL